jgi:hypothetical protein
MYNEYISYPKQDLEYIRTFINRRIVILTDRNKPSSESLLKQLRNINAELERRSKLNQLQEK